MASVPCTRRKRKSRKVLRRGRCRPSMAGLESLFGSDNLPNIAWVEPTAAFAEARLPVSRGQIRRMADLSAPADSKVCFGMPENPAPRNLRPFCGGRNGFDSEVVKPQNQKCDGKEDQRTAPQCRSMQVSLQFQAQRGTEQTVSGHAGAVGMYGQQIQIHPLPAFRVRAPGRKDRSRDAGFLRPAGRSAFPNP